MLGRLFGMNFFIRWMYWVFFFVCLFLFLFLSFRITEIITASPPGLRRTGLTMTENSRQWYLNATWTPSDSQYGPNLFCYSSMDNIGWVDKVTIIERYVCGIQRVPHCEVCIARLIDAFMNKIENINLYRKWIRKETFNLVIVWLYALSKNFTQSTVLHAWLHNPQARHLQGNVPIHTY